MASVSVSDYITHIVPPSPPRHPQDIEYNLASPPADYPHTPPYHHSPFSHTSDLDNLDFEIDILNIPNQYEPSEFDPGASLLMYTDPSADIFSHDHRSPFDPSSPSSNGGAPSDDGRQSRASSVASNHRAHPHHSPQPSYHPSPRLAVAHSLGNLTVGSPNWDNQPLPLSPPRLRLENQQQHQQDQHQQLGQHQQQHQQHVVPTINAPDPADDLMNGPQLHIVPATPVSGPGPNNNRSSMSFQSSLSSLPQELPSTLQDTRPASQPHQSPNPSSYQEAVDDDTPNIYFEPPPTVPRPRAHSNNFQPAFGNTFFDHRGALQAFSFGGQSNNNSSNNNNPNNNANNNTFLAADSLRRVVSDSPRNPSTHRLSRSHDDLRIQQDLGGPIHHLQQHHQQSFGHQTSNSIAGTTLFTMDFGSNQYLHPNMNASIGGGGAVHQGQGQGGNSIGGASFGRSLSPSGSAHSGGSGVAGGSTGGVGGGHHRRASSTSRAGSRRMSPYPSPNVSPRVSAHDLDSDLIGVVGNDLTLPLSGPMGMQTGTGTGGGLSGGGQVNLTGGGAGLEGSLVQVGEPPISAGYSDEVNLTGYVRPNATTGTARAESVSGSHTGALGDPSSSNNPTSQQPPTPIKQTVTTGRTAKASHSRRKQEASFACTVPGCNSTFTRGFNLKGHLRSHYEQKPYVCHWPGCGKGFARQHDCKRHEQLHSNFRPFECEGCGKQFARMDALNRHLRSEAGAECARITDMSGGGQNGQSNGANGQGGGLRGQQAGPSGGLQALSGGMVGAGAGAGGAASLVGLQGLHTMNDDGNDDDGTWPNGVAL